VTSQELQNLVRRDESEQLEFKQSAAQFPRAGETLCAFMNGRGGQVLVGVRPDGSVVGQTIADKTLQDLAQVLRRLDPPIPVETERISEGRKSHTSLGRRKGPKDNHPERNYQAQDDIRPDLGGRGSGSSSRTGPGSRDQRLSNDGGGGTGDDPGGLPEVESETARSGSVARYRQNDALPEAPGDGPRSSIVPLT